MRFILLSLIILTQCAWSWPNGWQQNPQIPGFVSTTNITLDASQVGQVIVFNNSAGTAANNTQYTLPTAVIGMQYTVISDVAKYFSMKPAATDIINFSTATTGKSINNSGSAAIGDSITLVCQTAGKWSIQNRVGTWVVGP